MRLARRLVALTLALPLAAVSLTACGSGISLDEPIEGPTWRLVLLGDQPVAPGDDPMRNPQLQFDRSSGRLSGSGGCNRMSGSFTRSASQLKLGQIAATKMACGDPARNALETQFFQALQATASYRLQGPGRMALLDGTGRTVAVFEAAR
ncbi:META domain protein [Xylophilus ampelinus]|nr:META domain-containing protein [Variovorax sp.]VTY40056.1 META domain protein [Xylophilus ampelinus]